jgi:hypothetical protein
LVDFYENWHEQLAAQTKQFSLQLPAMIILIAALQLPISNLIEKCSVFSDTKYAYIRILLSWTIILSD